MFPSLVDHHNWPRLRVDRPDVGRVDHHDQRERSQPVCFLRHGSLRKPPMSETYTESGVLVVDALFRSPKSLLSKLRGGHCLMVYEQSAHCAGPTHTPPVLLRLAARHWRWAALASIRCSGPTLLVTWRWIRWAYTHRQTPHLMHTITHSNSVPPVLFAALFAAAAGWRWFSWIAAARPLLWHTAGRDDVREVAVP